MTQTSSTQTSTEFISVIADGADWRETAKKALEEIQAARTEEDGMNFGFLYLSDALAEDIQSILTLFKSVTGINQWVGCVGLGVCGSGLEHIDKPALSVMIGHFEEDQVQLFTTHHEQIKTLDKDIAPWLKTHHPMLVLTHGQADSENSPVFTVDHINESFGGFVAGGLTSSRVRHIHFAGEPQETGFSGVAFNDDIAVATTLSQGGKPIGPSYAISKTDGNIIFELQDLETGQTVTPEEAFHTTIKSLVKDKTGEDADKIVLKQTQGEIEIPSKYQDLFQGDIHIGFQVAGRDQQDFMIRNILGIDPEGGAMAISEQPEEGRIVRFIHRDDETVRADLSQALVHLRARLQKEHGTFAPKGALYISCVARAFTRFKDDDTTDGQADTPQNGEMQLVKDIIGDVPLAGFYAGGEISAGRIYGYTGILILFL